MSATKSTKETSSLTSKNLFSSGEDICEKKHTCIHIEVRSKRISIGHNKKFGFYFMCTGRNKDLKQASFVIQITFTSLFLVAVARGQEETE